MGMQNFVGYPYIHVSHYHLHVTHMPLCVNRSWNIIKLSDNLINSKYVEIVHQVLVLLLF